jgi:hypothetical protein
MAYSIVFSGLFLGGRDKERYAENEICCDVPEKNSDVINDERRSKRQD